MMERFLVLRDMAHCLWVQTETVGHKKCASEDASVHSETVRGEGKKSRLKRAKRPDWFSPRNIQLLNILEKLCWK